jgi:hypothetical protein
MPAKKGHVAQLAGVGSAANRITWNRCAFPSAGVFLLPPLLPYISQVNCTGSESKWSSDAIFLDPVVDDTDVTLSPHCF